MRPYPTRRDVVVAGSALALASGMGPPTSGAVAIEATGIVSEAGKGPLSGVLVSNGRDVARTDASGRWRLPVASGQVIFVIEPAGFAAPSDPATRLPNLSTVYDPAGTPASLGFRYEGLPPTGPLPPSIDTVLARRDEPARFDVLLFTDPQPESAAEVEYVRDQAVAPFLSAATDAAFSMVLGDLAFDDLAVYPRLNRLMGRVGVPWWAVGGNHDLDYEAPDAARSRDTWKRAFGAPYHAHFHGQALFVMLDNVEYHGAGSAKPGDRHGSYRGVISDDQLAFVRNLLAQTPPETLLVFAMHIPLRTYLDPLSPANNTANAADLLRLIGDRPSVSFAGHTHTTEHHYLGADEGGSNDRPHHHHVLTAVSGSWWSGPLDHRGIACADQTDGTPNGYHVLSVDGSAYTTRYVPFGRDPAHQMRVSLEVGDHAEDKEVLRVTATSRALRSPIGPEEVPGARLVVNLFDGGPRSVVRFSFGGGAPVTMERVARVDPFVGQLYGRYPETIKPWVKPHASSHVWQAALPAGLGIGIHDLRVQAVDEYGRRHEGGLIVEVV